MRPERTAQRIALVALGTCLFTWLFARAAAADEPPRSKPKPRVEAGLAGMIGAAFWGNRAAATFGGPRLVIVYGGLTAGLSFFPSLVYGKDTDDEVRPMLGFGPELTVKRIVFFAPYYYLGGRVRPLVGVGWKF